MQSKQWRLASRPEGLPTKDNWSFGEEEVSPLGEDEVLLEVNYISLDPAMRGWMNQSRSYVPPVKVGAVMRAGTLSKVLESNSSDIAVGDYVTGLQGVQTIAKAKSKDLVKIDPSKGNLATFLGALGMPGMTAYFGLLDIGKPEEGDTVLISGAAGAVGSVVGQIAKIKGCTVIGIAGGPEKCEYLTSELGYDAAIDYKKDNVPKVIRKHCRKGVNVYFDNVGGDILEAALFNIARNGRIVICGAISQYNSAEVKGPRNYLSLLVNRASMEGMVVFDYADRYSEAVTDISKWIDDGSLKAREHIEEGIENFPETFLKLFSGGNFGKLLLKLE